jgi:uncharacterized membrane protein YheB (UPF0754 family)
MNVTQDQMDSEPLKAVKEHLADFYQMTEGNTIRDLIGQDIWNAQVESVEHANSLINLRLDTHISWLKGFKR